MLNRLVTPLLSSVSCPSASSSETWLHPGSAAQIPAGATSVCPSLLQCAAHPHLLAAMSKLMAGTPVARAPLAATFQCRTSMRMPITRTVNAVAQRRQPAPKEPRGALSGARSLHAAWQPGCISPARPALRVPSISYQQAAQCSVVLDMAAHVKL